MDGSIHSIIWKDILLHQKSDERFFTPIPHTYISSLQHGAARNLLFYLHGYSRSRNFIVSGLIFSYLLLPDKKTNGSELELNPGPLAS